MKTNLTLLALAFSIALVSCKSDPTEPAKGDSITGVVKDANGNPVAGAYLNFSFKLTAPVSALPKGDDVLSPPPSTTIHFQIPGRRYVKVLIENYVHQPIKLLVNDTLNAGVHATTWNGTNTEGKFVYSDCYFYKLWIGDSVTTRKLLLIADQHLVIDPLAYAQTDNAGWFSIPLSRIPTTETFTVTSASGTVIGTSRLEARQELYAFTNSHFGSGTVSLTELQDNTIVLSRQK